MLINKNNKKEEIKSKIKLHKCNSEITTDSDCKCPEVNRTSNIKYLGIELDDLKWATQCLATTKKMIRSAYIINKLKPSLNKYVLSPWGPASNFVTYATALGWKQPQIKKIQTWDSFFKI